MFHQMFAVMNEKLSSIMEEYEQAEQGQKQQLELQVFQLKQLSDNFIEQWLDFEERFALFAEQQGMKGYGEGNIGGEEIDLASKGLSVPSNGSYPCKEADLLISEELELLISKGQGYYKLFMFPQALELFEETVNRSPDCNLARLFLGMTHMHLQQWSEAERHFQLLISLTGFPKWLAMSYNALGCIAAVHMNIAGAMQLFKKAYTIYPGFIESLNNLKCCQETPKQLSLYFGSTELCCL